MGLLEDKLKNVEEKKKKINAQIQATPIEPTKQEQKQIDSIIKSISDENYQDISQKGINNVTDILMNAADDKISNLDVSYEEQQRMTKIIKSNIQGLGPIEDFMNDPDITEIMVLRYDHVVIIKDNKKITTNVKFSSEENLRNIIQRIIQPIGKELTISKPIVDARLKDGSRVNATIPPISVDGATLTIRRFSHKALTGEDYIKLGTMSKKMYDFLVAMVQAKANIIVSGGTNTGKTTMLNMLSRAIPKDEMIITIEDSCELQLQTPNLRRFETRPIKSNDSTSMNVDIAELVKNALRMNPDRIIVGEIRDGSIVDMISAMSTGHEGSMSTVHANSAANLVNVRMPILYGRSDDKFSEETQAIQIADALDLIVQLGFIDNKRVISSITEVKNVKNGKVELNDLFVYRNNHFETTGSIPKALIHKAKAHYIMIDESIFAKGEAL